MEQPQGFDDGSDRVCLLKDVYMGSKNLDVNDIEGSHNSFTKSELKCLRWSENASIV
jgi:hypothetical protein